MHPTDIPAFQTALGALDHGDLPTIAAGGPISEDAAAEQTAALIAALDSAHQAGSVVTACGLILDGFGPHVSQLGLDAARVLAGAAHLVLTGNWLGKTADADTLRDRARARIVEIEAT